MRIHVVPWLVVVLAFATIIYVFIAWLLSLAFAAILGPVT